MWWSKKKPAEATVTVEDRIRRRYRSFRELLSLNNECLELMSGVQEDLQFVSARKDIVGDRIAAIFEKSDSVATSLEKLSGLSYAQLHSSLSAQRNEVERYIAALEELHVPDFAHSLSEVDATRVLEVGGKAASLGEIRNKLHLPVPDGFVITSEAYRQFCGVPLWEKVRDATHNVDLNDLAALERISADLTQKLIALPIPRAIEVALTERAGLLCQDGGGLAVRSSAVGEGGERTFAGQFLSLINVPLDRVVDAYKRVVAGRFSERALFYRLSAGLSEVETPIAVLCLRPLRAHAAGIMYTRDPANPKSDVLWITSTRGLALDVASGQSPADLFVVNRKRPHGILEKDIASKHEEIVLQEGGGVRRRAIPADQANTPSLNENQLATLADWGLQIEHHFKAPQDVEWVLDEGGQLWIVQSRNLALASMAARSKSRVKQDPMLTGGRTVFPGRVSGKAHLVSDPRTLSGTPEGAILFVRRATPEIVEVFPRIAGLVAEWGNLTGHAAALLREAKIPSVFQMPGAFDKLRGGEPVSLDAVQPRVYSGLLWPTALAESNGRDPYSHARPDPISERLLTLHLLDPAASEFRPSGCRSAHDVLRFCHEKAIEAMFEMGDGEVERAGPQCSRKLVTPVPVNLQVLDLGGGLSLTNSASREVQPAEIVSRPFQALWRGVTHARVSWRREMPASLGDLASVLGNSIMSSGASRALGEKSYLLVADEYMNINSRLAYHYSLVDACVSNTPGNNYVSFRFAGGGAERRRRNLRACLVEACLSHYGFSVDRRGDLVNAWYRKAPAPETEFRLDILGRLMACTSQLDMYMTSTSVMNWYVQQFLQGNYSFEMRDPQTERAEVSVS